MVRRSAGPLRRSVAPPLQEPAAAAPPAHPGSSELKTLYAKRAELSTIYTPQSEPIKEINRLINEARGNSYKTSQQILWSL